MDKHLGSVYNLIIFRKILIYTDVKVAIWLLQSSLGKDPGVVYLSHLAHTSNVIHPAMKKNKYIIIGKWIQVKIIILSELNQIKNDKCHIHGP